MWILILWLALSVLPVQPTLGAESTPAPPAPPPPSETPPPEPAPAPPDPGMVKQPEVEPLPGSVVVPPTVDPKIAVNPEEPRQQESGGQRDHEQERHPSQEQPR